MFEYSPARSTVIIGATVIFGVVGGTYLLSKTRFFSQLTDRRGKKNKLEPCNVCFAELDVEDIKTCVPCCSCEKSVCRGKNCSYWLPKCARWECQLCNLSKASQCRTTEWINKQAKPENEIYHPIRARSELNIPILDDRMSMTGSVNYLPAYSPVPSVYGMNLDKQKIRNHVEEILAEMLGGSLDNISVGPMSRSTQYYKLFNKYHSNLSEKLFVLENSIQQLIYQHHHTHHYHSYHHNHYENQCQLCSDLPLWESNSTNNLDTTNPTNISHIKLKRLIERIIDETLRIPQLTDFSGVPPHLTAGSDNLLHQHYERRNKHRNSNRRYCNKISKSNDDFSYEVEGNNPQYFDPKRYQELLATAVLNKIVDTCAAEKRSVSEASVKKIDNNHNKIPITAEVCIESSSSSSHDPQSDSSLTDPVQDLNHINLSSRLYADALNENFNLESTISENSASFRNIPEVISSDNDSIEDYVSVASGADSTWEENWLFKKRKLLTHPTAPIGMLVPAPKEDIKAMIGDKSADEISDFSENDESDEINANAPENDRIQNKVVIGGQNIVGLFDDLLEQTSFISQSSSLTENMSPYTETKNNYVDYKYGLNVSENSSLDLTCSGMTLKTEAVNTAVAVNVMKCDKNTNSQENELNNNTECEDSKYSEIIVGATKIDSKLHESNEQTDNIPNEDNLPVENKENHLRRHSTIELLAAIALGPVLTVCSPDIDENVLKNITNKTDVIGILKDSEEITSDVPEEKYYDVECPYINMPCPSPSIEATESGMCTPTTKQTSSGYATPEAEISTPILKTRTQEIESGKVTPTKQVRFNENPVVINNIKTPSANAEINESIIASAFVDHIIKTMEEKQLYDDSNNDEVNENYDNSRNEIVTDFKGEKFENENVKENNMNSILLPSDVLLHISELLSDIDLGPLKFELKTPVLPVPFDTDLNIFICPPPPIDEIEIILSHHSVECSEEVEQGVELRSNENISTTDITVISKQDTEPSSETDCLSSPPNIKLKKEQNIENTEKEKLNETNKCLLNSCGESVLGNSELSRTCLEQSMQISDKQTIFVEVLTENIGESQIKHKYTSDMYKIQSSNGTTTILDTQDFIMVAPENSIEQPNIDISATDNGSSEIEKDLNKINAKCIEQNKLQLQHPSDPCPVESSEPATIQNQQQNLQAEASTIQTSIQESLIENSKVNITLENVKSETKTSEDFTIIESNKEPVTTLKIECSELRQNIVETSDIPLLSQIPLGEFSSEHTINTNIPKQQVKPEYTGELLEIRLNDNKAIAEVNELQQQSQVGINLIKNNIEESRNEGSSTDTTSKHSNEFSKDESIDESKMNVSVIKNQNFQINETELEQQSGQTAEFEQVQFSDITTCEIKLQQSTEMKYNLVQGTLEETLVQHSSNTRGTVSNNALVQTQNLKYPLIPKNIEEKTTDTCVTRDEVCQTRLIESSSETSQNEANSNILESQLQLGYTTDLDQIKLNDKTTIQQIIESQVIQLPEVNSNITHNILENEPEGEKTSVDTTSKIRDLKNIRAKSHETLTHDIPDTKNETIQFIEAQLQFQSEHSEQLNQKETFNTEAIQQASEEQPLQSQLEISFINNTVEKLSTKASLEDTTSTCLLNERRGSKELTKVQSNKELKLDISVTKKEASQTNEKELQLQYRPSELEQFLSSDTTTRETQPQNESKLIQNTLKESVIEKLPADITLDCPTPQMQDSRPAEPAIDIYISENQVLQVNETELSLQHAYTEKLDQNEPLSSTAIQEIRELQLQHQSQLKENIVQDVLKESTKNILPVDPTSKYLAKETHDSKKLTEMKLVEDPKLDIISFTEKELSETNEMELQLKSEHTTKFTQIEFSNLTIQKKPQQCDSNSNQVLEESPAAMSVADDQLSNCPPPEARNFEEITEAGSAEKLANNDFATKNEAVQVKETMLQLQDEHDTKLDQNEPEFNQVTVQQIMEEQLQQQPQLEAIADQNILEATSKCCLQEKNISEELTKIVSVNELQLDISLAKKKTSQTSQVQLQLLSEHNTKLNQIELLNLTISQEIKEIHLVQQPLVDSKTPIENSPEQSKLEFLSSKIQDSKELSEEKYCKEAQTDISVIEDKVSEKNNCELHNFEEHTKAECVEEPTNAIYRIENENKIIESDKSPIFDNSVTESTITPIMANSIYPELQCNHNEAPSQNIASNDTEIELKYCQQKKFSLTKNSPEEPLTENSKGDVIEDTKNTTQTESDQERTSEIFVAETESTNTISLSENSLVESALANSPLFETLKNIPPETQGSKACIIVQSTEEQRIEKSSVQNENFDETRKSKVSNINEQPSYTDNFTTDIKLEPTQKLKASEEHHALTISMECEIPIPSPQSEIKLIEKINSNEQITDMSSNEHIPKQLEEENLTAKLDTVLPVCEMLCNVDSEKLIKDLSTECEHTCKAFDAFTVTSSSDFASTTNRKATDNKEDLELSTLNQLGHDAPTNQILELILPPPFEFQNIAQDESSTNSNEPLQFSEPQTTKIQNQCIETDLQQSVLVTEIKPTYVNVITTSEEPVTENVPTMLGSNNISTQPANENNEDTKPPVGQNLTESSILDSISSLEPSSIQNNSREEDKDTEVQQRPSVNSTLTETIHTEFKIQKDEILQLEQKYSEVSEQIETFINFEEVFENPNTKPQTEENSKILIEELIETQKKIIEFQQQHTETTLQHSSLVIETTPADTNAIITSEELVKENTLTVLDSNNIPTQAQNINNKDLEPPVGQNLTGISIFHSTSSLELSAIQKNTQEECKDTKVLQCPSINSTLMEVIYTKCKIEKDDILQSEQNLTAVSEQAETQINSEEVLENYKPKPQIEENSEKSIEKLSKTQKEIFEVQQQNTKPTLEDSVPVIEAKPANVNAIITSEEPAAEKTATILTSAYIPTQPTNANIGNLEPPECNQNLSETSIVHSASSLESSSVQNNTQDQQPKVQQCASVNSTEIIQTKHETEQDEILQIGQGLSEVSQQTKTLITSEEKLENFNIKPPIEKNPEQLIEELSETQKEITEMQQQNTETSLQDSVPVIKAKPADVNAVITSEEPAEEKTATTLISSNISMQLTNVGIGDLEPSECNQNLSEILIVHSASSLESSSVQNNTQDQQPKVQQCASVNSTEIIQTKHETEQDEILQIGQGLSEVSEQTKTLITSEEKLENFNIKPPIEKNPEQLIEELSETQKEIMEMQQQNTETTLQDSVPATEVKPADVNAVITSEEPAEEKTATTLISSNISMQLTNVGIGDLEPPECNQNLSETSIVHSASSLESSSVQNNTQDQQPKVQQCASVNSTEIIQTKYETEQDEILQIGQGLSEISEQTKTLITSEKVLENFNTKPPTEENPEQLIEELSETQKEIMEMQQQNIETSLKDSVPVIEAKPADVHEVITSEEPAEKKTATTLISSNISMQLTNVGIGDLEPPECNQNLSETSIVHSASSLENSSVQTNTEDQQPKVQQCVSVNSTEIIQAKYETEQDEILQIGQGLSEVSEQTKTLITSEKVLENFNTKPPTEENPEQLIEELSETQKEIMEMQQQNIETSLKDSVPVIEAKPADVHEVITSEEPAEKKTATTLISSNISMQLTNVGIGDLEPPECNQNLSETSIVYSVSSLESLTVQTNTENQQPKVQQCVSVNSTEIIQAKYETEQDEILQIAQGLSEVTEQTKTLITSEEILENFNIKPPIEKNPEQLIDELSETQNEIMETQQQNTETTLQDSVPVIEAKPADVNAVITSEEPAAEKIATTLISAYIPTQFTNANIGDLEPLNCNQNLSETSIVHCVSSLESLTIQNNTQEQQPEVQQCASVNSTEIIQTKYETEQDEILQIGQGLSEVPEQTKTLITSEEKLENFNIKPPIEKNPQQLIEELSETQKEINEMQQQNTETPLQNFVSVIETKPASIKAIITSEEPAAEKASTTVISSNISTQLANAGVGDVEPPKCNQNLSETPIVHSVSSLKSSNVQNNTQEQQPKVQQCASVNSTEIIQTKYETEQDEILQMAQELSEVSKQTKTLITSEKMLENFNTKPPIEENPEQLIEELSETQKEIMEMQRQNTDLTLQDSVPVIEAKPADVGAIITSEEPAAEKKATTLISSNISTQLAHANIEDSEPPKYNQNLSETVARNFSPLESPTVQNTIEEELQPKVQQSPSVNLALKEIVHTKCKNEQDDILQLEQKLLEISEQTSTPVNFEEISKNLDTNPHIEENSESPTIEFMKTKGSSNTTSELQMEPTAITKMPQQLNSESVLVQTKSGETEKSSSALTSELDMESLKMEKILQNLNASSEIETITEAVLQETKTIGKDCLLTEIVQSTIKPETIINESVIQQIEESQLQQKQSVNIELNEETIQITSSLEDFRNIRKVQEVQIQHNLSVEYTQMKAAHDKHFANCNSEKKTENSSAASIDSISTEQTEILQLQQIPLTVLKQTEAPLSGENNNHKIGANLNSEPQVEQMKPALIEEPAGLKIISNPSDFELQESEIIQTQPKLTTETIKGEKTTEIVISEYKIQQTTEIKAQNSSDTVQASLKTQNVPRESIIQQTEKSQHHQNAESTQITTRPINFADGEIQDTQLTLSERSEKQETDFEKAHENVIFAEETPVNINTKFSETQTMSENSSVQYEEVKTTQKIQEDFIVGLMQSTTTLQPYPPKNSERDEIPAEAPKNNMTASISITDKKIHEVKEPQMQKNLSVETKSTKTVVEKFSTVSNTTIEHIAENTAHVIIETKIPEMEIESPDKIFQIKKSEKENILDSVTELPITNTSSDNLVVKSKIEETEAMQKLKKGTQDDNVTAEVCIYSVEQKTEADVSVGRIAEFKENQVLSNIVSEIVELKIKSKFETESEPNKESKLQPDLQVEPSKTQAKAENICIASNTDSITKPCSSTVHCKTKEIEETQLPSGSMEEEISILKTNVEQVKKIPHVEMKIEQVLNLQKQLSIESIPSDVIIEERSVQPHITKLMQEEKVTNEVKLDPKEEQLEQQKILQNVSSSSLQINIPENEIETERNEILEPLRVQTENEESNIKPQNNSLGNNENFENIESTECIENILNSEVIMETYQLADNNDVMETYCIIPPPPSFLNDIELEANKSEIELPSGAVISSTYEYHALEKHIENENKTSLFSEEFSNLQILSGPIIEENSHKELVTEIPILNKKSSAEVEQKIPVDLLNHISKGANLLPSEETNKPAQNIVQVLEEKHQTSALEEASIAQSINDTITGETPHEEQPSETTPSLSKQSATEIQLRVDSLEQQIAVEVPKDLSIGTNFVTSIEIKSAKTPNLQLLNDLIEENPNEEPPTATSILNKQPSTEGTLIIDSIDQKISDELLNDIDNEINSLTFTETKEPVQNIVPVADEVKLEEASIVKCINDALKGENSHEEPSVMAPSLSKQSSSEIQLVVESLEQKISVHISTDPNIETDMMTSAKITEAVESVLPTTVKEAKSHENVILPSAETCNLQPLNDSVIDENPNEQALSVIRTVNETSSNQIQLGTDSLEQKKIFNILEEQNSKKNLVTSAETTQFVQNIVPILQETKRLESSITVPEKTSKVQSLNDSMSKERTHEEALVTTSTLDLPSNLNSDINLLPSIKTVDSGESNVSIVQKIKVNENEIYVAKEISGTETLNEPHKQDELLKELKSTGNTVDDEKPIYLEKAISLERTSSDSTITDESTHTILDATDEAQIFSAKENSNQHSTKIYINGNNDQEGVLNIETSSEIDNVVLENTQTVTNNMEIGDSNVNDNKISTLTININNDLNNINLTEYNEIFIDSNNNTNTNVTNNEKNSVNVTYAINNQNSVLTSEKIEPLDSTSTNTIPKLIDIKKTEAFCRTLDMSDEDDQSISLIPGSIAEREHKKWYNAVEMPNNPYAPEALLRRLDTGPEKPLDIPDKRVSTPITTPEEEKIAEEALNTKKVDLSIYSRDYYVPSPTSNGTKNKLMKMPVIDMDSLQSDEKSFEENNSTLPLISEKIQNSLAKLNEQNDKPSISNIFDTKSDIFSAKLIQIVDSIDEEQYKKVNVSKTDSSPSDISLTNSLTLSEDSDTLRIYNLNKQETTFLTKENQLKKQQSIEESQNNNDNSRTPPNTPVTPTIPQAAPRTPRTRPNELKLTSESSQSSIKTGKTAMALTPQSFKFLHPKRKIIEPSQIMSHEQYSTPPETPDKLVIEEDVVSSLPSVKALARAFLLTTAKTTLSDDKISTKSLIVDSKNNEITQNKKKSSLGENSTIEEPSVEAMQDENQNNLQNSERPISPILKPGKLKDNIAFFENLKKNE